MRSLLLAAALLPPLVLAQQSLSRRSRCALLDRVLAAAAQPANCTAALAAQRLDGFIGPQWTHAEESCLLYLLGRLSRGPLAEQGPFLGASTIAIASGLRDSEDALRTFTTSDAFPTPAAATASGSRRNYPHYWRQYREPAYTGIWPFRRLKRDGAVTMNIDGKVMGTMPLATYMGNVAPYSSGPNGQMGTLVSNLKTARVDRLVDVITASRIPRGIAFEVVWSDSTHNVREIEANVPALLEPAVKQPKRCVTLALHDINNEWARGQIVAVNATAARQGERRRAVERVVRRSGCEIVRRAAAGLIYAVTLYCSKG